mgnify:FL=1
MAIIGFSKHGKGGGKGVGDYLMNPDIKGRENNPPECVRGDIDSTVDLIDSIDNKWKYTSGVVSFSEDTITPEQEEWVMDKFEEVAFAGLDKDQYDISWVRHSHAGHAELHFVTPRIELTTGKALNIKPPGKINQDTFDDLRREINHTHGFSDPDDPERQQMGKEPNHIQLKNAELKRQGVEVEPGNRESVTEYIKNQYKDGFLKDRDDVVKALEEIGCSVPRKTGKHYLTAEFEGHKFRLKGGLYERDWDKRQIEIENRAKGRRFNEPDPESAGRYGEKVKRHIENRAKFNRGRYQKAIEVEPKTHEQTNNLGERVALASYIRSQLGDGNSIEATSNQNGRTSTISGILQRDESNRGLAHHSVRQQGENPVVRESGHDRELRGRLPHHREQINDQTGTTIIERFKATIERTKQTFSRIRERIRDISNETEQATESCGDANEVTAKIDKRTLRQAQRQAKRNDPDRSFGPER